MKNLLIWNSRPLAFLTTKRRKSQKSAFLSKTVKANTSKSIWMSPGDNPNCSNRLLSQSFSSSSPTPNFLPSWKYSGISSKKINNPPNTPSRPSCSPPCGMQFSVLSVSSVLSTIKKILSCLLCQPSFYVSSSQTWNFGSWWWSIKAMQMQTT